MSLKHIFLDDLVWISFFGLGENLEVQNRLRSANCIAACSYQTGVQRVDELLRKPIKQIGFVNKEKIKKSCMKQCNKITEILRGSTNLKWQLNLIDISKMGEKLFSY